MTVFQCSGRLLVPATLDPRIITGSQAQARINGRWGRFELLEDISINRAALPSIRQAIEGTFRLIGGGS